MRISVRIRPKCWPESSNTVAIPSSLRRLSVRRANLGGFLSATSTGFILMRECADMASLLADPLPELPEMESLLASVRDAVTVEESALLELELTRRNLLPRSPVAGCVVEMTARRGQALLAGQPVAFVAPDEPAEIVCYVPHTRGDWPEPGTSYRSSIATCCWMDTEPW